MLHASYSLVVENVLARDRIEPPPPAFSVPLPMDLSGLELADRLKRKLLEQCRFRIVWDHLGWFPPQVVPVLFPRDNQPISPARAKTFSLRPIEVATKSERLMTIVYKAMSAAIGTPFKCCQFPKGSVLNSRARRSLVRKGDFSDKCQLPICRRSGRYPISPPARVAFLTRTSATRNM